MQFKALSGCNVVMVQRLASTENMDTLKRLKDMGLGIVYDLDDDMWSVAASNPAAPVMKALAPYLAGFDRCSELADMITCSTGHLESSIKTNMRNGVPTRVINNAIDMDLFQPCILPKDPTRVVIGWGGSATHGEDLQEMGSSLFNVMRSDNRAFAHFVGMVPNLQQFIGHPRVLAHGWVPVSEYPARLATWNWDIYLAPLTSSRFNRSKSCIKALEAGALKIPCLMSDVQPFREFTSHDKELQWLLCSNPKQWFEKLHELVSDDGLRQHLGEVSYKVTRDIYSMKKKVAVWKQLFDSVAR